ncbi:hypothetical protein Tco_0686259 [Tanacetum coccineum]
MRRSTPAYFRRNEKSLLAAELLQLKTFESTTQASEIIAEALSISCYSKKLLELKGEALFQNTIHPKHYSPPEIVVLEKEWKQRALKKVIAFDCANTEGVLLPVSSTFNVVDTDSRTISSNQDDAEADEMIICLEDRLRAEGILGSDEDLM